MARSPDKGEKFNIRRAALEEEVAARQAADSAAAAARGGTHAANSAADSAADDTGAGFPELVIRERAVATPLPSTDLVTPTTTTTTTAATPTTTASASSSSSPKKSFPLLAAAIAIVPDATTATATAADNATDGGGDAAMSADAGASVRPAAKADKANTTAKVPAAVVGGASASASGGGMETAKDNIHLDVIRTASGGAIDGGAGGSRRAGAGAGAIVAAAVSADLDEDGEEVLGELLSRLSIGAEKKTGACNAMAHPICFRPERAFLAASVDHADIVSVPCTDLSHPSPPCFFGGALYMSLCIYMLYKYIYIYIYQGKCRRRSSTHCTSE